MRKVMIIGNAAGGKSLLASQISERCGLPLHRLDDIMWQPGWVPLPAADFAAKHASLLADEHWVIHGYGPHNHIPARIDAADTIIFVDLPFATHLWWATKRQIKSLFTPQGPAGCPMWRKTVPLYAMMWDLHKNHRTALLQAINTAAHADVHHLQSRAALAAFAATLPKNPE